jgi:hypothetical protein
MPQNCVLKYSTGLSGHQSGNQIELVTSFL